MPSRVERSRLEVFEVWLVLGFIFGIGVLVGVLLS